MSEVKILAVVGMSGSGKSTVIDYLTEKSYPKIYFGGMILKEMNRRDIVRTADSEREFRERIRAEEGTDWVVRQAITEANNLINAGQKRIVLDGLYSWTEYKILKKQFPTEMTTVAVIVDKRLRHKRLAERPERPFNEKEANERDWSEIENLEKGGPIAIADHYLDNSGSIADLHGTISSLIQKLDF